MVSPVSLAARYGRRGRLPRGGISPRPPRATAAPGGPPLGAEIAMSSGMAPGSAVVASYRDFAADLVAGGVLSDPWVDGTPRFRMTPVVLDVAAAGALRAAGEA